MDKQIIFQELGEKERILLLRAFGYDVDGEGYVLDFSGQRVKSDENPKRFIQAKFAALLPGSLKIIDGTPTAISEFLREREVKEREDAR